MEDLHLVLPALNLSILMDAGILIMVQQVRLRDFSVTPSPLGTNFGFELGCTGLGLGLGRGYWD